MKDLYLRIITVLSYYTKCESS